VSDTVDAFPAGYVPKSADDLPDGVGLTDIPVSPGTLDTPDGA
jgi:hypothetical protein